MEYVMETSCLYLNIGRSRGGRVGACPPPPHDPILSFSHTFSLESAHVGGQNPPKMGPRPPPRRKILDSALLNICLRENAIKQIYKPSAEAKITTYPVIIGTS